MLRCSFFVLLSFLALNVEAQFSREKMPESGAAIIEKDSFTLQQNFPNPVVQSTHISFKLEQDAFVSLRLFDSLGNEAMTLVNGKMKTGEYDVLIDASRLNSGIYFYRLVVNDRFETKKLTIRK